MITLFKSLWIIVDYRNFQVMFSLEQLEVLHIAHSSSVTSETCARVQ